MIDELINKLKVVGDGSNIEAARIYFTVGVGGQDSPEANFLVRGEFSGIDPDPNIPKGTIAELVEFTHKTIAGLETFFSSGFMEKSAVKVKAANIKIEKKDGWVDEFRVHEVF